ncbi:MAG TPA: hypothetical protein VK338_03700 [Candidatus Nitrosocosmicus sp.]|nr:hypothetical protein [Candidatus Nitrosocosmicus sp.]
MKNRIDEKDVLDLLYKACPSFQTIVERDFNEDDKQLLYVVAGRFAAHLLDLYQKQNTKSFPLVAQFIESLHIQGTKKVQELAILGFLEGIQNVWSHSTVKPDVFFEYLLPESKKSWRKVAKFWKGEIKVVGEPFDQEESN